MSTILGKVKYVVDATDVTKAKSEFDKLGTTIGNTTGKGAAFGRALAAVGVAAAGVAASIGLAIVGLNKASDFALKAAESIGEIGNKADALGLTTKRFQELRAVAISAGIATQDFDRAFEKFNQGIGDAQRNTGQLVTVFKEMDISLKDANGAFREGDDLLQEFARKVNQVGSANKQLSLSAKAFGEEGGKKMLDMLRMTEEQQNKVIATATKYGLIIDEVMIRKADAAANELNLMNRALKAQADQAALSLAPLASWWSKVKVEVGLAAQSTLEFFGVIDNKLSENLALGLDGLNQRLVTLQARYEQLDKAIKSGRSGKGTPGLYNSKQQIKKEIADIQAAIDELNRQAEAKKKAQEDRKREAEEQAQKEEQARYKNFILAKVELDNQLQALRIANIQDEQNRIYAAAEEQVRLNRQKAEAILKDEELSEQQKQELIRVYEAQNAEIILAARRNVLDKVMKMHEESFKESMAAQAKQLRTDLENQTMDITVPAPQIEVPDFSGWKGMLADFYDTAKKYDVEWKGAVANSFDSATEAVVRFASTGKFSFRDFANQIIQDLIRIAIQKAITAAIGGALGYADGGILPTERASSGTVIDSHTTIARGGRRVTMGEGGGPEGVLPLRRLSNGDLGVQATGGGSGGGITIGAINVSVQGGKDEDSGVVGEKIGAAIRKELEALIDARTIHNTRRGNILNPTAAQLSY